MVMFFSFDAFLDCETGDQEGEIYLRNYIFNH